MLLSARFAALALSTAVVGIDGLMNYAVVRMTHEIGTRMALVARRRDVLWFVLKDGAKLVLAGVAIGLLGALALTQLMGEFIYGVGATDPATVVVVVIILINVALLASYIPASRAMRVDPAVALRHE